MKHIFLTAAAVIAFGASAQAGTLQAESLVCMSQKLIKKYEKHQVAGEQRFMEDMIDRAQCYIQKRPAEAAVTDTSGTYIRLELLGGNRVWVNASNYGVEGETSISR